MTQRLSRGIASQEHSCEIALAGTVTANNTILSNTHGESPRHLQFVSLHPGDVRRKQACTLLARTYLGSPGLFTCFTALLLKRWAAIRGASEQESHFCCLHARGYRRDSSTGPRESSVSEVPRRRSQNGSSCGSGAVINQRPHLTELCVSERPTVRNCRYLILLNILHLVFMAQSCCQRAPGASLWEPSQCLPTSLDYCGYTKIQYSSDLKLSGRFSETFVLFIVCMCGEK